MRRSLEDLRDAAFLRSSFSNVTMPLSFIRRSRDLGFSLDQVRALLRLSDDRSQSCAEVDRIARLHLGEVERKIADLTALGGELRQVIGQCRQGTIAECRIIEALGPASVRTKHLR